jgi:pimeloyl-ACP methyl ester carboxylesterase
MAGLPLLGCVSGRNFIDIRGHAQDVYYYPARGAARGTVLFLPGDGGWRGFALDMAEELAGSGMDVYGWDVKRYLSEFTAAGTTLSQEAIQADTAALAEQLGATGSRKFVLAGWSQGAAMAVLAAATPEAHKVFSGVVVLGVPETGVLGWRFADNLTYVTKRAPSEPNFETAPCMAAIAPLRLAMIESTEDEYVSLEATKRLFSLAREPKRLTIVPARDHRYDGNRDDFFRILTEQVKWAAGD